jgi:GTP-binding protein
MSKGFVAIVGRPNVGKSTLFNRLLGERKAVVDIFPGVTRDRNYAECLWNGRTFTLVDTGGYVPESVEGITDSVSRQVEIALGEADLLVFVVDAQTGPTDYDEMMASMIRDSGTPYKLVVNKIDRDHDEVEGAAFYGLALGDPLLVSAINGRQSGDLLDEILAALPETEEDEAHEEWPPRIAVLGRPNNVFTKVDLPMFGRPKTAIRGGHSSWASSSSVSGKAARISSSKSPDCRPLIAETSSGSPNAKP